ncbi:glmS [Symbiodinium necroappetens]|uniref:GlmS protein n=1 Tax=Symbiodinium necroappetens TaxID=1628268 RepID=A0A812R014_9DINO|nr:glmS [Symbiodinium necroappetens]
MASEEKAERAGSMQAPLQIADRISAQGMLSDIWETPRVLRQLIQAHLKDGKVDIPGLRKPLPEAHGLAGKSPLEILAACSQSRMSEKGFCHRLTVIGSGTSWHAAILAEYLIETMARIPVESQYASEFRYREPTLRTGDVLVVVSMSGETTDAVEALRRVRNSPSGTGVLTIAIVNQLDSTLARECDFVLDVCAGQGVGVASTKTFSATNMMFVLLSLALADECGQIGAERESLVQRLQELPDSMQEVLDKEAKPLVTEVGDRSIEIGECPLWDIGCQNVLARNFIFLGRGFNFPIALEGAMKCKELAYIHAEGYPAAEMKHGPIALIDEFMPVVVICPKADATYEKIKSNIEEVRARNGATIAITEKHNHELEKLCEYVIGVPETHEYLMPLLAMLPLQLLAYMMGILKGNAVDAPRGLVKSVSVSVKADSSPPGGYVASY